MSSVRHQYLVVNRRKFYPLISVEGRLPQLDFYCLLNFPFCEVGFICEDSGILGTELVVCSLQVFMNG